MFDPLFVERGVSSGGAQDIFGGLALDRCSGDPAGGRGLPRVPGAVMRALLLAAVLTAAFTSTAHADPWQRVVDKQQSRDALRVDRDASAQALARAAIERSARALGLQSLDGIRFASEAPAPPPAAGARALRTLRFQQSVGGLRVLWSEIDVAVTDDAVTSISATTVPFTETRLAGRQRVSPAAAVAIAKRALPGSESALPAQPIGYAGTPGKPKSPRRAWVVQLQPAEQDAGADHARTICVVVDADRGKVLMRYEGFVSQAQRAARAAAAGPTLARIFDAGGGTGDGTELIKWTGDLRNAVSIKPIAANPFSHPIAKFSFTPIITVQRDACIKRDFCIGQVVNHRR